MRLKILLACFLCCLLYGTAVTAAPASMHLRWTQLLQKHVTDDGQVNYRTFQQDKAQLQAYLDELAKETPHPEQWAKAQQKVYWINAYNAFAIKLVLDNYPLRSLQDLSQEGAGILDRKFITLGRQQFSLNQIENELLLARFHDPRLHFALVPAAKGAPRLRNEAYTADKLDYQLDEQVKEFLQNPRHNQLSPEQAQLSELFERHAADFRKTGPLYVFLNKYAAVKLKPSARISYLPYDWALNEAA